MADNSKHVAVVTGGTRGIGAACSIALKRAGYDVVAIYNSNTEAAKKFQDTHNIPVYKFNCADFHACELGLQRIVNEHGQVDVLVNNAGIIRDAPLHKMTYENWHLVIDTNLDSLFNMTRCVIESMRERGYGRIVNITSMNAQRGMFGQSNYSASKAGIIGFTKSIAQECAKKGVTVNCIAPGYIETDMLKGIPDKVMQAIVSDIPVGRVGQPEEIARAVVFLSDEEAGYITGSTLTINGGQYVI